MKLVGDRKVDDKSEYDNQIVLEFFYNMYACNFNYIN